MESSRATPPPSAFFRRAATVTNPVLEDVDVFPGEEKTHQGRDRGAGDQEPAAGGFGQPTRDADDKPRRRARGWCAEKFNGGADRRDAEAPEQRSNRLRQIGCGIHLDRRLPAAGQ